MLLTSSLLGGITGDSSYDGIFVPYVHPKKDSSKNV